MSALDHRALDRAGTRFVYVLGALTREASSGRVPGPGLTQVNEAAWRLVELVGAARIMVDANGAQHRAMRAAIDKVAVEDD